MGASFLIPLRAAWLVALPLLVGCAELSRQDAHGDFCGMAGELRIFVEPGNAFTHCEDALTISHGALEEEARIAGALESTWDVLFTWHLIDISGALAQTDPSTRLIRVGERQPRNVLHELLHARLMETGQHGSGDHAVICAAGWDGAERAFGIADTCRD